MNKEKLLGILLLIAPLLIITGFVIASQKFWFIIDIIIFLITAITGIMLLLKK